MTERPHDSGRYDSLGRRIKLGARNGPDRIAPPPPPPPDVTDELPDDLVALLPERTAETWRKVAPIVPPTAYLAGGTGLTVHLLHRISRDLDFMFDGDVNLGELERELAKVGRLAVTQRSEGTLNAILDSTKIQFLAAPNQRSVGRPTTVAGVVVASVADIAAMKLKVILDRGELRDYFDLMEIDRREIPTEESVDLFRHRYQIDRHDQRIAMLVRSLGYLDDVADDPSLPLDHPTIARFWERRAMEVTRHLGRWR